MTDDDLVTAAAANNAAWCAAVCRTHAIDSHSDGRRWWSQRRTPLYYPDVVTIAPDVDRHEALRGIETGGGASVKDSFGTLDLEPAGFHELFRASWIHLRSNGSREPSADVDVVSDAAALRTWIACWAGDGPSPDVFRPALPADPDVRLLIVRDSGSATTDGVIGVCALNVAAGLVGVSNLVSATPDALTVWTAAIRTAGSLFPGLDLVGYESGQDLEDAVDAGFSPIGDLRVWIT